MTCPSMIKDIKNVETELTRWEEKVKTLQKHFGEKFSDLVKIGIVTSVLPIAIQDYVYTTISDKPVYDGVNARIRSVVSNKVAMSMGPTPMDIGGLQGSGFDEYAEYENENGDIDAVGSNIQCHRCKGWGHMIRECPTKDTFQSKGKGKNAKGDDGKWGKGGKGKGNEQHPQNFGKGKGKGINGECFNCGKWGHQGGGVLVEGGECSSRGVPLRRNICGRSMDNRSGGRRRC